MNEKYNLHHYLHLADREKILPAPSCRVIRTSLSFVPFDGVLCDGFIVSYNSLADNFAVLINMDSFLHNIVLVSYKSPLVVVDHGLPTLERSL